MNSGRTIGAILFLVALCFAGIFLYYAPVVFANPGGEPIYWNSTSASGSDLASNASAWSTGVAPIAGDNIIFNGTSSVNCTWDLAIATGNFTIDGYTGILTQAANFNVSNFTQTSGTFTGSTSYTLRALGDVTFSGGALTSNTLNLVMAGISKVFTVAISNVFTTLTFSGTTIITYTGGGTIVTGTWVPSASLIVSAPISISNGTTLQAIGNSPADITANVTGLGTLTLSSFHGSIPFNYGSYILSPCIIAVPANAGSWSTWTYHTMTLNSSLTLDSYQTSDSAYPLGLAPAGGSNDDPLTVIGLLSIFNKSTLYSPTGNFYGGIILNGRYSGISDFGTSYINGLNLSNGIFSGNPATNLTFGSNINIFNNQAMATTNFVFNNSASINVFNGSLSNVTMNGTRFWVNGTNFSLSPFFSIPPDNSTRLNISRYLNVTNLGAGVFDINFSYSDIGLISESDLRLYEYNGSDWLIVQNSQVDTVNNIVYASNITSFSIFAPMSNSTVLDFTAPNIINFKYNVTNSSNYSSTQGYQFNATIIDTDPGIDTVWIEHNFTGVMTNNTVLQNKSNEYYYDYGKISVGYYYVKWYANDTYGNLNNSDWVHYYQINKSYLSITLYINGINGDISLYNNTVANFTANLSSTSLNISLWTNLTGAIALWDTQTNPLTNYTNLVPYPAGQYIIKANWSNENYTYSQANHTLTLVEEGSLSIDIVPVYPINDTTNTTTETISFGYNVTYNGGTPTNCSLYTNETAWGIVQSNASILVNASINTFSRAFSNGTYLWAVSCWDQINSSISSNYTVTIALPITTIYWNSTSASGSDLASNASAWSGGVAPTIDDNVIFNSTSTNNCTWDLPVSLGTFSIVDGYTGVITNSPSISWSMTKYNQTNGTFTGDASSNVTIKGNFTFAGGVITNGTLNLVVNSPTNINISNTNTTWAVTDPYLQNYTNLILRSLTIYSNVTISGTMGVATQQFYLASGKSVKVTSGGQVGGLIYAPIRVTASSELFFTNLGTIIGTYPFQMGDVNKVSSRAPLAILTASDPDWLGSNDSIILGNVTSDVVILFGNIPGEKGWHYFHLKSNTLINGGLYFDTINQCYCNTGGTQAKNDNVYTFYDDGYNITTTGPFVLVAGAVCTLYQSGIWNIFGGINFADGVNYISTYYTTLHQNGNINTTSFAWVQYIGGGGYDGDFIGNTSFNVMLSDNFTFPDALCYYDGTCGGNSWSNINLVMTGNGKNLTFRPARTDWIPLNSLTISGNITIVNVESYGFGKNTFTYLATNNLTISGSLNLDDNRTVSATNLTLSGTGKINVLKNGSLVNITMNGTRFWVNGTNFSLSRVLSIPSDDSTHANIGKYVNITNLSSGVIDINFSYSDSDIAGINESLLAIYDYNGTGWTRVSNTSVDTVNNIVYATNITSFSIFAPMEGEVTTNSTMAWVNNNTIVNGLVGILEDYSTPSLIYNFANNNLWTLITGESNGVFYGFQWNGTGWDSNDSIVNGLGDVGTIPTTTVIYNFSGNSKWTLIAGEYSGLFYGFQWNGTGWETNTTMVNGLDDVGDMSAPTVTYNFANNNLWTLITGESNGVFYGFQWNGTGWDSNDSIVNGLGDVGDWSIPTITYNFADNGKWTLIAGERDGVFNGFQWNGASWVSNDSIVAGLEDVGLYSSPTITYNFADNNLWTLISGDTFGDFYGYQYTNVTTNATSPSNSTIVLNWPDNNTLNTTGNIQFGFTPTFYGGVPVNCSLWTNETNWHMTSLNTSILSNGTINTIQHNFSINGTYLWAVSCWDQTQSNTSSNYTLTIAVPEEAVPPGGGGGSPYIPPKTEAPKTTQAPTISELEAAYAWITTPNNALMTIAFVVIALILIFVINRYR